MQILILAAVIAAAVFITLLGLMSRYKRCPADRILVIYGKTGRDKTGAARSARCIHGGAAFIWPLIQDYQFLDLRPMSIEVALQNALSKQNIRVDVPSRFTVGISTEPEVMQNAAERLLGLNHDQIIELSKDILFGQLRLVIATMDIEEINSDRDKFLINVSNNVEAELKKIGLKLINVNVTDIRDESAYIAALGKEAAAKAINDAKKTVAERNRDGAIGEAEAVKDERISVSDAVAKAKIGEAEAATNERVQISLAIAKAKIGEAEAAASERIQVADANAKAVDGENKSKVLIADSNAIRREKEAEANRKATAAEKVATAKALEEAYRAEQMAEQTRAAREKASKEADVLVPAEIDKRKVEIDAEAEAEKIRRQAKGEADAILMKMQAEAQGHYEVLSKQADGFRRLMQAAGEDPRQAILLMITEKLPDLVRTQVEAIKNIKIDKVTVWDQGGGKDGGSQTSTANFISGLARSIPPMQDLFNMAGMELPDYLGTAQKEGGEKSSPTSRGQGSEPRPHTPGTTVLKTQPPESARGDKGGSSQEPQQGQSTQRPNVAPSTPR